MMIQRSVVLILILTLFTTILHAQRIGFVAGVEGGMNFYAPVTTVDTGGYSSSVTGNTNFRIIGGPYLLYQFNKLIAFKTAAWYTPERLTGTDLYYPDLAPPPYGLHSVRYYASGWKVPVMVRFRFGKMIKYYFELGPSINFLSDRNETYYRDTSGRAVFLQSKSAKETSAGFCFGAGGSIALPQNLFLSLEGIYSVNGSAANAVGGVTGNFNLLLGIGYQFWVTDKSDSDKGDIFYR